MDPSWEIFPLLCGPLFSGSPFFSVTSLARIPDTHTNNENPLLPPPVVAYRVAVLVTRPCPGLLGLDGTTGPECYYSYIGMALHGIESTSQDGFDVVVD